MKNEQSLLIIPSYVVLLVGGVIAGLVGQWATAPILIGMLLLGDFVIRLLRRMKWGSAGCTGSRRGWVRDVVTFQPEPRFLDRPARVSPREFAALRS